MKSLLLFFIYLLSFSSSAQSLIWEHLFPANRANITLIKTLDGHLVTSGIQYGPVQFPSNLAKFDTSGNLIWQKAGRIMHTGEQALIETPDGNYLHAGNTFQSLPGNLRDTYMQPVTASGDTLLAQTFIEPGWDYPTDMILLNDNNVAIAGLHLSPSYFTLRKTDLSGNTLWFRRCGYSANTYGTLLVENSSREIVLVGMTRPLTNPFHPYLVKIDQNGNYIDSAQVILKTLADKEVVHRFYNNIIQTSDGGYAFGGIFDINGFIAKTDSNFNLLWYYEIPPQQSSSNEHTTTKLIELQDSTLLFMSKDNDPTSNAFYITRLNSSGQFLERKTLQSSVCPNGNMLPYAWQFLEDSSIVFSGWCISNQQAYIGRWGNLNFPLPMQQLIVNAGANESVCAESAPFPLSGYSPAGGTWSGTGVSITGVFTPSVIGTHTLTYTVSSGNQTASSTKAVTVHALPVPNFTYTLTGNQAVFSNTSTGAATYSWSFGDGNISAEPNPSHTYSNSGSYSITLTAITVEGCTATTTQTISLTATANQLERSVKLYPNPTTGLLQIEQTEESAEPVYVEIFSTQGQLVKRTVLNARQSLVDLSALADGVYQVKLLTGQAVLHRQVVLMRLGFIV